MDCFLQPLLPVPLLLFSLALGDVGLHQLTFVGVADSGTPRNFREIFIGRCEEYQRVLFPLRVHEPKKNCNDLWQKFYLSFAYKDKCDYDIHSYDEYIRAAEHDVSAFKNKVMYWSGRVTPLVYEFTDSTTKYETIRKYLPGYIVKNVEWCGKKESTRKGPGMDFSHCHRWGSCGDKFVASEAFWKALSSHFARLVEGEIQLMLNGGDNRPAYSNKSTFAQFELPYLNASRNPILHVYLVHKIEPSHANNTSETCDSRTLKDLQNDINQRHMVFKCVDDPRDVLHFQCIDHLTSARCQFAFSGIKYQPQQQSLTTAVASSFFVTGLYSIMTRSRV